MFQEPVLPFPIVIYKIPSEIEVAPCYKVHVNCFTYTAFAVHTFYTIFSVYTVYTLYTAYIDSTAHTASVSPPVVTNLTSVPIHNMAVVLSGLLSKMLHGWMDGVIILSLFRLWIDMNAWMEIMKLCKFKIK